jgi:hypothetical protein
MLELAHDEELLVDQNDTARLILPVSLFIFLQNETKTQLVERDQEIKMLVVSRPEVSRLGG